MLACALYEFYALVDRRPMRNPIKPTKLIESEAKGDDDFKIKFGQRLGRGLRDFIVEPQLPAKNSHDEFRGEGMVWGRKALVSGRVEQFGCVREIARDAEENVEGGGAGRRDWHSCRL